MSSKRRLRRKACDGKLRFGTQAEAWEATASARASFGDTWLRPYRCPHCHEWHMGHPPGSNRLPMDVGRHK